MNAPTPHWAVRDTLTGTTYRQPNKLIAEKVAAMHGASEVIQVPPPSADEHEEQARELRHLEVEQRLEATVATVQRARTEVDGVVWTDGSWRAQRDVVGRLLAEVSTRGALTPPTDDVSNPNSGEGWYAWQHMPANTSHIAYVHENGEVYLPESPGDTDEPFLLAAAAGHVHRLVRADEVRPRGTGTDAEHREAVHSAVRAGIESVRAGVADRDVVRAVADRVLELQARP